MKSSELRGETIESLTQKAVELSQEIFSLRNELQVSRKLDQPHLIREKKRERARVLTILREKQKGSE